MKVKEDFYWKLDEDITEKLKDFLYNHTNPDEMYDELGNDIDRFCHETAEDVVKKTKSFLYNVEEWENKPPKIKMPDAEGYEMADFKATVICDECEEEVKIVVNGKEFWDGKVGRVRCDQCGHISLPCNICCGSRIQNCADCPFKNAKIAATIIHSTVIEEDDE